MSFTTFDIAHINALGEGRKRDDWYMYHCPFHKPDKDPSFGLHENGEGFHCFGCNAEGNKWDLCAQLLHLKYSHDKKVVDAWLRDHGLLDKENIWRRSSWSTTKDPTKIHKGVNLMINETCAVMLPTLCRAIGLHEGILCQQIHFLIFTGGKPLDDSDIKYVHFTYAGITKNLPWAEVTTRRAIRNLEKAGIIITVGDDRTKWYAVDYEKVQKLLDEFHAQFNSNTNTEEKETEEDNSNYFLNYIAASSLPDQVDHPPIK